MKKLLSTLQLNLLALFFLLSPSGFAQILTDSNLPIVVITTDNDVNGDPMEIPDDPRVLATMKIIKRTDGSRNSLADINTAAHLNYNGRINIEIRGSSSQWLDKKPYGLTTLKADNVSNNNVSLLDMPSENDWVLNSFAYDPTLMRDYISYTLARQIGQYAPRVVYCEVIINGDYKGLYLLSEKIKVDGNRVNIVKIAATDNDAATVSGGYISKADKDTGGDPIAWEMDSYNGSTNFIHDVPNPTNITTTQAAYIESVFRSVETLTGNGNASITTGYPTVIDVPTFIDFILLAEVTSNVDAYQLSTFFHKDRNGKLRAGPIWDYNLTFGNDLFQFDYDRSQFDVWQLDNGDNTGAKLWKDLFDDATFRCYLSKRFNQLTPSGKPLNSASLLTLIDETKTLINEAVARENTRWATVPNHTSEITALKNWVQARLPWMTSNLGSFTACNAVTVPSLVITKINYNPKTTGAFTVSNDMEFIEIKNTGAAAANLSGVYFSELGITYQFPANATLAAGSSLFLASNSTVFFNRYGQTAFGQFTRNLSNSTQKLVLSDAFGNVIDVVNYADNTPWPAVADGQGSFLQLSDPALDNNVAANWTTATELVVTGFNDPLEAGVVSIYPNPANHNVSIQSPVTVEKVQLTDNLGKEVMHQIINATSGSIDVSGLSNGIYILKITVDGFTKTEKIVKY